MQSAIFRKLVLAFSVVFGSVGFSYDLPKAGNTVLDEESANFLQRISKSVAKIAKESDKGVVFVSVSKVIKGVPFGYVNPFDFFFGPRDPHGRPQDLPEQKQQGLGSGFIVDLDKGYILTNNHVIEGADEIHIKLRNGLSYDGKVVGRDKNTDIAVVQISDPKFKRDGLVALTLMDNSDDIEVGEMCMALGAPFGLEASISLGVVSAIGRGNLSITDLGNFIQTDAAINPGNSGGPLLNMKGQVMGINTAIFSRSGGYNGIGFSIPGNLIREVAGQLIDKGKMTRGYLGVVLADMEPDLAQELGLPAGTSGALTRTVEPDSPASKAGMEAGDVIIQVDNEKVDSVQKLRNVIGLKKPGTKVTLHFFRDGKQKSASVVLANYSDVSPEVEDRDVGEAPNEFGLSVEDVSKKLKDKYKFQSKTGAVVVAVRQGMDERSDMQPGDVIVKVNKTVINNAKDFWREVKGKSRILARIERQGQFLIVPLRQ